MFWGAGRLCVKNLVCLAFLIHNDQAFCVTANGPSGLSGAARSLSEPATGRHPSQHLSDGSGVAQGTQETSSSRRRFDDLIAALSGRAEEAGGAVILLASELSKFPQNRDLFSSTVLTSWKPVEDFVSTYSPERANSFESIVSSLLRYRRRALELLGQPDSSSRAYDDQVLRACTAYAPICQTAMSFISFAFVSGSRDYLDSVASVVIPLLQETLKVSFRILARAGRWKRTVPGLRQLIRALRHLESLNIACKAVLQMYYRAKGLEPEAA